MEIVTNRTFDLVGHLGLLGFDVGQLGLGDLDLFGHIGLVDFARESARPPVEMTIWRETIVSAASLTRVRKCCRQRRPKRVELRSYNADGDGVEHCRVRCLCERR